MLKTVLSGNIALSILAKYPHDLLYHRKLNLLLLKKYVQIINFKGKDKRAQVGCSYLVFFA